MSLYVYICHHLSTVSLLGSDVDFSFYVCVGGLSGGPLARKPVRGVVPFAQPTTNQGQFVTSCEVVSTPGRTFGERGTNGGQWGATEAIRAPPYILGTEFLMLEVLSNARAA